MATLVKKGLSAEIPEDVSASLDELAGHTGRKKNLLVGASLYEFLSTEPGRQGQIIRQHLTAHTK